MMLSRLPDRSIHIDVRVSVILSVNCLKALNSMTKGSDASSTR